MASSLTCYDRHELPLGERRGSPRKGRKSMESLTSGTLGGAGSFRCQHCGYVLTLTGTDRLTDCPGCGGQQFVRASLFSTERIPPEGGPTDPEATLAEPAPADREIQLAK